MSALSIIDACNDERLFANWFRDKQTWKAWFAFLAALFALPMTPEQLAIFRQCTGRTEPSAAPHKSATLCIGRRGGKSFVMALIAIFLGCFRSYREFLQPGERATILVIAADRRQSRVVMRYVSGLLHGVPMLERMIENERADSFDLQGSVTIEISTANFRTVRGYSLAAAICDEIAFWQTEDGGANPDKEIINALKPAQATIPGSMLICASSPYAKRGALWDSYQRYWGKDDAPELVWQAATRVMNPSVPESMIEADRERDPQHASSEWDANFRDDITSFIDRQAIMDCIKPGLRERAPERRHRYVCGLDLSGGRADSAAIAICHKEGTTTVLDLVREIPAPHNPETVVQEFSDICRRYRIVKTFGDKYAAEWPVQAFRERQIVYEANDKTTSELFIDLLPLIHAGAVDLLDHDRMTNQLCALERRVSRTGRDIIGHPPNGHDDVAAAVASALVRATRRYAREAHEFRPVEVASWHGNFDIHRP
jgi:hypothetical protein